MTAKLIELNVPSTQRFVEIFNFKTFFQRHRVEMEWMGLSRLFLSTE
jgi:hypothetical protein